MVKAETIEKKVSKNIVLNLTLESFPFIHLQNVLDKFKEFSFKEY